MSKSRPTKIFQCPLSANANLKGTIEMVRADGLMTKHSFLQVIQYSDIAISTVFGVSGSCSLVVVYYASFEQHPLVSCLFRWSSTKSTITQHILTAMFLSKVQATTHPISKEKSQMHINPKTQNSFHNPTSPNSAPSPQSPTPRAHKFLTSGSQFSTTLSNNLFIFLYRPKEMY